MEFLSHAKKDTSSILASPIMLTFDSVGCWYSFIRHLSYLPQQIKRQWLKVRNSMIQRISHVYILNLRGINICSDSLQNIWVQICAMTSLVSNILLDLTLLGCRKMKLHQNGFLSRSFEVGEGTVHRWKVLDEIWHFPSQIVARLGLHLDSLTLQFTSEKEKSKFLWIIPKGIEWIFSINVLVFIFPMAKVTSNKMEHI